MEELKRKNSFNEFWVGEQLRQFVDRERPNTLLMVDVSLLGYKIWSKNGHFFGKKKGLFNKPFSFQPCIFWRASSEGIPSGFVVYNPQISHLVGCNPQCKWETVVGFENAVLEQLNVVPVTVALPEDREIVESRWTRYSSPDYDFEGEV